MVASTFRFQDVPIELQATLRHYGFDEQSFAQLQADLSQGKFPLERNMFQGSLAAPPSNLFTPWPAADSAAWRRYHALGMELIQAGKVAMVVLNGGMATRFGGKVKGIVDVVPGVSFLQLKLGPLRLLPAAVPVFLMNSFSTDEGTKAHLQGQFDGTLPAQQIHCFTQGIALRLQPNGDLFYQANSQPSLYAPGHGDLLWALRNEPAFQDWYQQGPDKVLFVSNVDNLGATLSPVALAIHHEQLQPISVEVAAKQPEDTGGAPVLMDGKLEVLEGFRFPASFAASQLPFFNTNSFWLQAHVLTKSVPLTWFRADKTVEQRTAVQFERLLGEISHWYPANYQQVPRTGPENRFLPVKQPNDLASIVPYAQTLLRSMGGEKV